MANEEIIELFKSFLYNIDSKAHLDNMNISPDCMPFQGAGEMAKINRAVTINGTKHWIRANTEQEYCDKLLALSGMTGQPAQTHNFREYSLNWFELYAKPNIETATATTYKRQLTLYLIPALGDKNIEDITVDDIQMLFNGMSGTKATKDKARMVLSMIFDNAIEDGLISKNPVKSKRLKITGSASRSTVPYSVAQMKYIVQHLDDIKSPSDRVYMALQALHPLRLEEVLGLKWEDVDIENNVLHIRRAVTHPTRNQPEIKDTKTKASTRDIGLSQIAIKYLSPGQNSEFVLGGEAPLSYTQLRKVCERIKRDIGFDENITPIRFRTTVLSDIYEATHDIKQAQAAAGHTTSAMTLKYYVKGRSGISSTAAAIDRTYS